MKYKVDPGNKNTPQDNSRYMVLLADRKKAIIFTFVNGQIEDHDTLSVDDVPQNVRANERDFFGRSDIIFRHIEDHLHRHLKLVAKMATEFARGKHINFILIGGHLEMFEKIKKHLPKNLQDKVIGEFVAELNIPLDKILAIAKVAADKIQEQKNIEDMEETLKGK